MTDRPTKAERDEAAKLTDPCRCVMCAERHGDHATTEEEREIDRLRDENATLRGRVLTLEARAERTELAEAEIRRAGTTPAPAPE